MLRVPRADVVLEVVDLVVEAVDNGQEPFGDLVDQEIEAHSRRRIVTMRRGHQRVQVALGLTGRCLANRNDSVKSRDHVDLVAGHTAVVADLGKHEEAEDVVPVRLQPRARLVVVAGRGVQPVGDRHVQIGGHRGLDRRIIWIGEVDPPMSIRHAVTIWVTG